MCAIAGIIGDAISVEERASVLQAMLSASNRRGPDSHAQKCYEGLGFAHAQLHIMQAPDSCPDAIQPYELLDRYVLTWNGSIYNYIALRAELIAEGCVFTTDTDTEVVAQGLALFGENFLEKLNGIFALSFWDRIKEELVLAVDRFGVKPLHYSAEKKSFVFASEIKQLLLVVKPKANLKVLVDFLLYNCENNTNQTAFGNIMALRAGEIVRLNTRTKEFNHSKWHHFDFTTRELKNTDKENIENFSRLSIDAIQRLQNHKVKAGLGLSGGLDSSWILYNLKKCHAAVNAFTVGFSGEVKDERIVAKQLFEAVANRDDSFTPIGFEKASLLSELDDLSYIQEEPFADPSVYMQYRLMKIASSQGVRVMISGQGADELLLGYERYSLLESLNLPFVRRIMYFKSLKYEMRLTLKKYFVFNWWFSVPFFRISRVLALHKGMREELKTVSNKAFWRLEGDSYKHLTDLYSNEISYAHLPKLLRYEDRNSAAFGIEGRPFFLENELAEFVLQLPQKSKLLNGQTKKILRDSLRNAGLAQVASQKVKIGFNASLKLWEPAHSEMEMLIENSKILKCIYKQLPNYRSNPHLLWKLQSIARWEKVYKL